MKYHLTVLTTAIRIIIGIGAVMAIYNFIMSAAFFMSDNNTIIKEHFSSYFTPFTSLSYHNTKWLSGSFAILYGILLIYGTLGATRVYYCLKNINNGGIFYEDQANEFKRAGANIIIFAKLKYILFCAMGTITYFDLVVFLKQIPAFITLYLIGKSLLVINYVIQKGETIKHENDLTI